ncbi:MAG TPA: hypothetical protein VNO84_16205 [Burkholderiaceae bacterium]|nr:hypothetical protein [Burkholderiaceae bacterium]
MPRCFLPAFVAALALPVAVHAQTVVQRSFPQEALRGEIVVTAPPEITLNGQAARLAPGARIRGQNNLLVMSGAVVGTKLPVLYTTDTYGLVKDVWILRADEQKKLWPKTREEAASWAFDPAAQVWAKR